MPINFDGAIHTVSKIASTIGSAVNKIADRLQISKMTTPNGTSHQVEAFGDHGQSPSGVKAARLSQSTLPTADANYPQFLNTPAALTKWKEQRTRFREIDKKLDSESLSDKQKENFKEKLADIRGKIEDLAKNGTSSLSEGDRTHFANAFNRLSTAQDKLKPPQPTTRERSSAIGSESEVKTENKTWMSGSLTKKDNIQVNDTIQALSQRELTSDERAHLVDSFTSAMSEIIASVTIEEAKIDPQGKDFLNAQAKGDNLRPNLTALNNMSMGITNYIAAEFWKQSSAESRITLMSNLTRVAQLSLNNGNMLLAMSIVQGLRSTPVRGLKIEKELPAHLANSLNRLDGITSDFMSFEKNVAYIQNNKLKNPIPNVLTLTSRFISLSESDGKTNTELKNLTKTPPPDKTPEQIEKKIANGNELLKKNEASREKVGDFLELIKSELPELKASESSTILKSTFNTTESEVLAAELTSGSLMPKADASKAADVLKESLRGLMLNVDSNQILMDISKNFNNAPTLQPLSQYSTALSKFAINSVLSKETPQERAAVISNFARVMQSSIDRGDFQTAISIHVGITKSSLERLKKTNELLDPSVKTILEDSTKLFNPEGSNKALRDAVASGPADSIPPLNNLLKDIIFVYEGNTDSEGSLTEEGKKFLEKIKSDYENVQEKLKASKKAIDLSGPLSQIQYMDSSPFTNEIERQWHEKSLQLEPRERTSTSS